MSITTSTQPQPQLHDEHILVVKRTTLLPEPAWHGLKQVNFDEHLALINTHKEFLPRSIMETDPSYKQIIPYLIFEHNNRYFLMQRQAKASETRLQNKFTLGIGGHIRQEDMTDGATLFDWARREFHEEVAYSGALAIEPVGLLNDDSNAVGQVHIGFVLLLRGNSDNISVKSELKSGFLATIDECQAHEPLLESWSQVVLAWLAKQ
jgi:predicted NUDIX family phosphoesterase